MIQEKELPNEYISIRQIWLRRIDDCGKAISQRAIQESSGERQDLNIGDRTVVFTVDALYYTLVDYGEATVRSDVDKYKEEKFTPAIREIWAAWNESQSDDDDCDDLTHFKGMEPIRKPKSRSLNNCWRDHARESMKFLDYIIQTLNRFGMLFEKQPEGYSNIEMRSVE